MKIAAAGFTVYSSISCKVELHGIVKWGMDLAIIHCSQMALGFVLFISGIWDILCSFTRHHLPVNKKVHPYTTYTQQHPEGEKVITPASSEKNCSLPLVISAAGLPTQKRCRKMPNDTKTEKLFKTDQYCARNATTPRGPVVGVALKYYKRSAKCVCLCVLSSVSHPSVE